MRTRKGLRNRCVDVGLHKLAWPPTIATEPLVANYDQWGRAVR